MSLYKYSLIIFIKYSNGCVSFEVWLVGEFIITSSNLTGTNAEGHSYTKYIVVTNISKYRIRQSMFINQIYFNEYIVS